MSIIVLSKSPILHAEKVDCPTCKERAPWRCRAKSGRTTDPHVARRNLANGTPDHMLWAPPASDHSRTQSMSSSVGVNGDCSPPKDAHRPGASGHSFHPEGVPAPTLLPTSEDTP